MKSIIAFLLSLVALFGLYAQTAIVTDLDYENDIVTVENANGFAYQFYGCEDYDEGDFVSMICYSNGTEVVTDDVILSVRYSGFYR